MNEENQFLGQENISTLMRKYAIPCIISLLVGALYNIVDQIFIANAKSIRVHSSFNDKGDSIWRWICADSSPVLWA